MYRKPLDFNSLPIVIQEMIEDSSHAAAIIDELVEKKGETNAKENTDSRRNPWVSEKYTDSY